MHLYASFQKCFAQHSHSCQGDLIPFDFALVHQRVRDRTGEDHVDSEAEAEIFIIRVVSIERWRLIQASQVFEQVCNKVFRPCEAPIASPRICGFKETAPPPCMITR